jgi:hypothetical protein
MQTVGAFWKASSGDTSWHVGRDRAQHARVVNDHRATSNLVAPMWQVKVTGGRLCISACRLHVVSVVEQPSMHWVDVGLIPPFRTSLYLALQGTSLSVSCFCHQCHAHFILHQSSTTYSLLPESGGKPWTITLVFSAPFIYWIRLYSSCWEDTNPRSWPTISAPFTLDLSHHSLVLYITLFSCFQTAIAPTSIPTRLPAPLTKLYYCPCKPQYSYT